MVPDAGTVKYASLVPLRCRVLGSGGKEETQERAPAQLIRYVPAPGAGPQLEVASSSTRELELEASGPREPRRPRVRRRIKRNKLESICTACNLILTLHKQAHLVTSASDHPRSALFTSLVLIRFPTPWFSLVLRPAVSVTNETNLDRPNAVSTFHRLVPRLNLLSKVTRFCSRCTLLTALSRSLSSRLASTSRLRGHANPVPKPCRPQFTSAFAGQANRQQSNLKSCLCVSCQWSVCPASANSTSPQNNVVLSTSRRSPGRLAECRKYLCLYFR